jgi:hypothetical protein
MSPDHKYESLTIYGAIRPITTGNYPIFKTQRLIEEIANALVNSEATDYLALSGSNFVAALCLLEWLLIHKECNVLLYDSRQRSYVPRPLKKAEIIVQIEKERDKVDAQAGGTA